MILAQRMNLLEAGDRVIARGVVPIDTAEGPPKVVTWDGETFVLLGWHGDDSSLDYRKVRVMHAGENFEAVR